MISSKIEALEKCFRALLKSLRQHKELMPFAERKSSGRGVTSVQEKSLGFSSLAILQETLVYQRYQSWFAAFGDFSS